MKSVTTKMKKDGDVIAEATVECSCLNTSLAEKVESYGEAFVNTLVESDLTVKVQGYIRGLLKSGKTAEEVQALMLEFDPTAIRRRTTDPLDKVRKALGKLPPEEVDRILAKIREENAAVE